MNIHKVEIEWPNVYLEELHTVTETGRQVYEEFEILRWFIVLKHSLEKKEDVASYYSAQDKVSSLEVKMKIYKER